MPLIGELGRFLLVVVDFGKFRIDDVILGGILLGVRLGLYGGAAALLFALVGMVQTMFRPTRREFIIALFTGFFVSYWVLTIFGTSFRGAGQDLAWPWNLPISH